MKVKPIYYLTPGLLAVIIFVTNFLSTNIFTGEPGNFAVWFVISVFAFACGWLIDKTMGWNFGGKIVFSVAVSTAVVSLFMVSIFSNYFNMNNVVTESYVLYSLRNIMIGAMSFFGMSVAEVLVLQKKNMVNEKEVTHKEQLAAQAEQIAELTIKEAKLKAEKIVMDAEKKSIELIDRKQKIQSQLKEFIFTEKELIKKYESEIID